MRVGLDRIHQAEGSERQAESAYEGHQEGHEALPGEWAQCTRLHGRCSIEVCDSWLQVFEEWLVHDGCGAVCTHAPPLGTPQMRFLQIEAYRVLYQEKVRYCYAALTHTHTHKVLSQVARSSARCSGLMCGEEASRGTSSSSSPTHGPPSTPGCGSCRRSSSGACVTLVRCVCVCVGGLTPLGGPINRAELAMHTEAKAAEVSQGAGRLDGLWMRLTEESRQFRGYVPRRTRVWKKQQGCAVSQ